MAWFAQAAPYIMQAGGSFLSSEDQAGDLRRQSRQTAVQAKQVNAAAQRSAIDERRNAQLAVSRGQALAAASGAGTDDPTVVNLLADIAGEGEYRALSALYTGEQQAQDLVAQAGARSTEARNASQAGLYRSGASLFQGASSLYDRYGSRPKAAAAGSSWVGPR